MYNLPIPSGLPILPQSLYIGIDPTIKNLNTDPLIRNRLTKRYRYLVLDKWLYSDLKSLLGYFTVSGDKVELVKQLSLVNKTPTDSESDMDKKTKFIEDKFLTVDATKKILKKFNKETDTQWINFPHTEGELKRYFKKYLKSAFQEAMSQNPKM